MKFLLVLLLACQTAAIQHIFGHGGVVGDGQFEIKLSDNWGYDSDELTVSSKTGEGVSKGTAAGIPKGGDVGTGASGGDAKRRVEGETGGEGGGTIEGEKEREKEGSAGSANSVGKAGDSGAFEGDATEVIQGGKKGNSGEKDHDETGRKRGDDSATKAIKRSKREAVTSGGDSEGVEDESAKGKGGDIGGRHKRYFYDDEADSSEAEDDFSEYDDMEGGSSETDAARQGYSRPSVLNFIPRGIGKAYKGFTINGVTHWYHFEDDGIVKRGNERDKHGVLGGLLPSIPQYVSKISSSGHLHGLIDKILHVTDKETGQKFLSVLQPSGEIKDDLFKYLIKNLGPLSVYEVMEVVKYRIQRDRVLAIFASYMESDLYTNHRLELKEEPSVGEFLNGTAGPYNIPIRNVYYNHLRAFIRRLFCSCPSKAVEPFGYPRRSVTTLLIKLPISEVAKVMVASVKAKPEFFSFTLILNHLNDLSAIVELNAIRASDKYNKMRTFLSTQVNVGLLDNILKSFFGFDLALIFSVYTIV